MSKHLKLRGITLQVRVSNFQKGLDWYSGFMGRPPDFLPHEGFANQAGFCEWELIPGSNCWIQVAEGDPAVNTGPIRFGVASITTEVKRIVPKLNLREPEIATTPDGKVKFCTFSDPFGNRLGFFEE